MNKAIIAVFCVLSLSSCAENEEAQNTARTETPIPAPVQAANGAKPQAAIEAPAGQEGPVPTIGTGPYDLGTCFKTPQCEEGAELELSSMSLARCTKAKGQSWRISAVDPCREIR